MGGLGELAAFATALGWAVSSYAHGLVGRKVGAAGVTLLRLPFQMTVLGLACLALSVDTSLSGRALLFLFLSGAAGVSVSDFMLYKGMTLIGPQRGILLLSLSAAITASLGWLFLQESLTAQAILGIAVTLAGIATVVGDHGGGILYPGQEEPLGKTLALGVIMVIAAALFQSISFIFWKAATREAASPLWATFVRLLFAAAILWGMGLFKGWSARAVTDIRTRPDVFRILLGASLFSAGGMWAAGLAIDMAPAGVAATIIGLQPVLVTILTALLNRRPPSYRVLFGTVIAFTGTALICLR
ncbi:MAG: DMT family transporter [Desulfovibrio sp.]|nr:DMT family transporter [Desulfovibrio sp.]